MDADKKKIWIRGQFVEVTDEVYAAYMKGDRKIRYFENDLKTGRTVKDKDGNIKQILPSREDSLDRLMEDNAQQFPDSHESVEDIVIQKISTEKLHMALLRLPKKDQELIYALFYEEKTERVYAEQQFPYTESSKGDHERSGTPVALCGNEKGMVCRKL